MQDNVLNKIDYRREENICIVFGNIMKKWMKWYMFRT